MDMTDWYVHTDLSKKGLKWNTSLVRCHASAYHMPNAMPFLKEEKKEENGMNVDIGIWGQPRSA